MKQEKQGIYARCVKRLLDILLSGCALIVLSPVLLVVAILVRFKLGSPVIFCGKRIRSPSSILHYFSKKMYSF